MSDTSSTKTPDGKGMAARFPTAYSILFGLIIVVAALTWIIPAGQYDRAMNEEVGREIGLTRERVRQIQVEALKSLRGMFESIGLSAQALFAEENN